MNRRNAATEGGSLDSQAKANANKKPKKEPSEILNLFTKIKTKPTLKERRAFEEKEKESAQKLA